MSDGTLFAIGAVVFIISGLGAVWYMLDVFQAWRQREAAPDQAPREPSERILHRRGDTSASLTDTEVSGR